MKIKWLGHSCFLIESIDHTRVITDPYTVYATLRYDPVGEAADVVTVSHEHRDHNNVQGVKGDSRVISEHGTKIEKGIQFKSILTYHDNEKGEKRGKNIVNCFIIDGIRICHLGDLGHLLGTEEIAEIGTVDVLLIPVGGFYTIDAAVATKVCDSLKPKVVIPMHFKTAKLDFPITTEDDFLAGKSNVKKMNSSEVELTLEKLPKTTEIIVLKHAR